MIPLLKHRVCPLCGHDDTYHVQTLHNLQFFSDLPVKNKIDVTTVQCRYCLCVYMNPVFTSEGFARCLSKAGPSYGSPDLSNLPHWLQKNACLEGPLLDVGCGTGKLLRILPSRIRRIGFDIDSPSIEKAKISLPDCEFICTSWEKFASPVTVRTITLLHVLEHLSNPSIFLKKIAKSLDIGGKIICETPIIDGKIYNDDIVGFYSPFHCTHFSKNTLRQIFFNCGYEPIKCEEINDYNGYRIIAKYTGYTSNCLHKDSNDRYSAILQYIASLESIIKIKNKIEIICNADKLVVWGCGMHLELLYQKTTIFYNRTPENTILIDSDKNKQGTYWRSFPIYSSEILHGESWNNSILLVSSYGSARNISIAAMNIGVPKDKILVLYNKIESR